MDQGVLIQIGNDAMLRVVYLSAPLLIAALAMGLLVSIIQAATQIQEQTLSFIPKLLAIAVALAAFGPWMLQTLINYTVDLYLAIPLYLG
jgi:flagellar biosynthesis protein FliQ